MKFDLNTVLWIALIVLVVLYLRSCDKTPGEVEITTETKSDTVYVKGKPDTVPFPKVEYQIKWLKPDKEYITVHDTIYGDSVNVFTTHYSDSMLEGSIITSSTGEVRSTKLIYTPKFPKYITSVDTMRITDSTTVTMKKNSWGLYFGGVVGGNVNSFEVTPTLLIKSNKNLQFSYGYGVINKTHNLGVYTVIPNPFKK